MELHTLGALSLSGSHLSRPKPLLLLAYLAIEGPRPRGHLCDLFWPDAARPANSLRVALRQVRADAPDALGDDGARLAATVDVDAVRILHLLEDRQVAAALDRYRGPFLEGARLGPLGPELEEWVFATRELLADRVREATVELAEREAADGEFAAAAARAEAALALRGASPADPGLLARVHRLATAAGAGGAAIARVEREAREYGVELRSDRAAARAELLSRAGRERPAAAALPVPLTSFVGRELERLDLARLLNDPSLRSVTLTGPGGIGKSRLALEAAHAEAANGRFEDGVAYVSLASMNDPAHLPAAIARAAGVVPAPDAGVSEVVGALREKRLLLVLDDCEHLVGCGDLVAALLAGCPGLVVLATSRAPLDVAGEARFVLDGLAVGAADAGADDAALRDAERLFLARGRRVRPELVLADEDVAQVRAICRLVDGSPLGIELAAAWLRFLTPAAIADEVARSLDFLQVSTRGIAPRHASLRATFEHSWRLLTPEARRTLRRLSVFEGGFTRGAAARVAGGTIPRLAALHDMAMLRVAGHERWVRHPLVHAFTAERLAADPAEERATRTAHAEYFLNLAREAAAQPPGPARSAALARLERDHDNLRAALRWTLGGGDPRTGLALAAACYRLWYYRSHFVEGLGWLREALARTSHADDALRSLRSDALQAAGVLALHCGEGDAARAFLEERLAVATELDDPAGRAAASNSLGVQAWGAGDLARAQALLQESLRLRREAPAAGDPAVPLVNLGLVALARGDLTTADAAFTEALSRSRAAADPMGTAIAASNLAAVRTDAGRASEATALLREAAAHYRTEGDRDGLSHCLEGFAAVAALEGRHEDAARLAGAAAELRERIGSSLGSDEAARRDRRLAAARRALGAEAFARAESVGRARGHAAALDEVAPPAAPGERTHVS